MKLMKEVGTKTLKQWEMRKKRVWRFSRRLLRLGRLTDQFEVVRGHASRVLRQTRTPTWAEKKGEKDPLLPGR
jgi:ligand-binding SRPBCC domain-containing protein